MALLVRRARLDDLPRVIMLLAQLSLDTPREKDPHDEAYRRAFELIDADPRQRLVVAELDGDLVGTGTLIVIPNLSHGGSPVAQLESIVVDRAVRGRGIGEAIVRHLEEEAKRMGCFRLQLTSNIARPDAHRFYVRLGYAATHTGFKKRL